MTSQDYITIQDTRVLMPSEWERLRAAMITPEQHEIISTAIAIGDLSKANRIWRYQIICDMLLMTGMRIVEATAMDPAWYRPSRRVVVVPKGAHKKVKCTFSERTVMLSTPGCDAVERYLASGLSIIHKVPMRDALRRYAVKAGIGETGITSKMFRKTLVSWLMACYPEREMYISASMGHDRSTLQKHYLGLGFPRSEVDLMREKYLKDWGVL